MSESKLSMIFRDIFAGVLNTIAALMQQFRLALPARTDSEGLMLPSYRNPFLSKRRKRPNKLSSNSSWAAAQPL
ncbi:MAG: hypothetical protein DMG97_43175 [Acidobacteria bacterium]|nr:MAG: hypothetical protein DMG97_43175 [Acidobacteriota bacterium]